MKVEDMWLVGADDLRMGGGLVMGGGLATYLKQLAKPVEGQGQLQGRAVVVRVRGEAASQLLPRMGNMVTVEGSVEGSVEAQIWFSSSVEVTRITWCPLEFVVARARVDRV